MSIARRKNYPTENILDSLTDLKGVRRDWSDLKHPGLLALDPMVLFCDPTSPAYLPGWEGISQNFMAIIGAFKRLGRPLAVTRHIHPADDNGGLIGRFFGRLQRSEDTLAQLIDPVSKLVDDAQIHEKARHSPLGDPRLVELYSGCDSLVIIGVQTQLCVLAAALDCAPLNLVPIVVVDATASINRDMHLAALSALGAGHAHLVETAPMIDHLSALADCG